MNQQRRQYYLQKMDMEVWTLRMQHPSSDSILPHQAHTQVMVVSDSPLPPDERASFLFKQMLSSIGLLDKDIYVTSLITLVSDGNSTDDEAYRSKLWEQVQQVGPKAILALGVSSSQYLSSQPQTIERLRGRIWDFCDTPVVVTHHPTFLLEQPTAKKEAMFDLFALQSALHH